LLTAEARGGCAPGCAGRGQQAYSAVTDKAGPGPREAMVGRRSSSVAVTHDGVAEFDQLAEPRRIWTSPVPATRREFIRRNGAAGPRTWDSSSNSTKVRFAVGCRWVEGRGERTRPFDAPGPRSRHQCCLNRPRDGQLGLMPRGTPALWRALHCGHTIRWA